MFVVVGGSFCVCIAERGGVGGPVLLGVGSLCGDVVLKVFPVGFFLIDLVDNLASFLDRPDDELNLLV